MKFNSETYNKLYHPEPETPTESGGLATPKQTEQTEPKKTAEPTEPTEPTEPEEPNEPAEPDKGGDDNGGAD